MSSAHKFVRLEFGEEYILANSVVGRAFRRLNIIPDSGLYAQKEVTLIKDWKALEQDFQEKKETTLTLKEAIEKNYTPGDESLFVSYLNEYHSGREFLVLSDQITSIGSLSLSGLSGLKEIRLSSTITQIGSYAFYGSDALTEMTIPETIESIEDHVFANCTKLQKVLLKTPQTHLSDYMFQNCSALKEVNILDNVTSLGIYAFSNCAALEALVLPENLKHIDDYAFHNCVNLKTVGSLKNIDYVGDYAFYGCAKLANIELSPTTNVDTGAFYGCSSLTSVIFGDENAAMMIEEGEAQNTIEIKPYAFYGCSKLGLVWMPDEVTISTIGKEAFGNCTSLTTANWKVDTIKEKAFKNCSTLIEANFLTATTIEKDILQGCGKLQTLSVPCIGKITNGTVPAAAGSDAMLGYFFGENQYTGGEKTEQSSSAENTFTYYIPSSLTSVTVGVNGGKLHQGAFENCRNITNIILKQSDYYIGTKVFYGCESLISLDLSKATSIAAGALGKCSSLTELKLPFIGQEPGLTENKNNVLFGFIFETAEGGTDYIPQDRHYRAEQNYWTGAAKGTSYYYIPESLETVNIAVGPLYYGSFSGCEKIKSINIKDTEAITTIPENAFLNCAALERFDIPQEATSIGVSAFQGCSSFSSIVIPSSVTSISELAFADCTKVSSLTLAGVLSGGVGTGVFKSLGQNTSGVTVTFGDNVTTVPSNFFYNESTEDAAKITRVVLHNNIESLGESAFKNCTYLTNLTIPNSIDTLTQNVLAGCTSLVSIVIPDSITSIGANALSGCSSLLGLTLPDSLESIGQGAFASCSSLKTVRYNSTNLSNEDGHTYFTGAGQASGVDLIISASVTSIPQNAFKGLKIGSIKFEGAACQDFGADAFADNGIDTTMSVYITDVGAWIQSEFANENATPLSAGGRLYENDNEITECTVNYDIHDYVFRGCESIEKVTIDQGVKSIGNYAFSGCTNLSTLEFAENSELETIGVRSFSGCEGLTEVSIPSTVETINDSAFAKCKSITTMTLPFVGKSLEATNQEACFGYIFGEENPNDEENYYGAEQYYDKDNFATHYIPASLNSVIICNGEILSYGAFRDCKNLQFIVIPDTITEISHRAFALCTSLKEIILPSNLTSLGQSAFYDCSNLSSIEIPDGITTISYKAFSGCSGLEDINLEGIETIDDYAFYGCSELKNINLYEGITTIGVQAFRGCSSFATINVPNTTTSIGEYAFYDCIKAETITIGTGVTSIGKGAFANCSNVSEINFNAKKLSTTLDSSSQIFKDIGSEQDDITVTFGSSVEQIPDYLFYVGSTNNIYVQLPISEINFTEKEGGGYSCTTIGQYAFTSCAKVTELAIPVTVTSIGQYCLGGCKSLQTLTVPFVGLQNTSSTSSSSNYILGYWFSTSNQGEDYYGATMQFGSSSTSNITVRYVPNSLTKIVITNAKYLNYGALSGMTKLQEVSLEGEQLNTIYTRAFSNCTNLTTINLGEKVQTISGYAFYNCDSLHEITVPESVTAIGQWAFSMCSRLEKMTLPFVGGSSGDSNTFGYIFDSTKNDHSYEIKQYYSSNDSYTYYIPLFLTEIEITGSTTINAGAFCNCANFSKITMSKAKQIATRAFQNCTALREINIPNTVTSISDCAFYNCTKLTTVVMPDSVTAIPSYAFYSCSALSAINIPKKVTSIGSYAFYNCKNIEEIVLPDSLTTINSYAFSCCTGLVDIVIPKTVASIYANAFEVSYLYLLCEAGNKPSGWNTNWNICNCPVEWNYQKQEREYRLHIDDNNNQTLSSSATIKLPTVSKEGYYFGGWYTTEDYSTPIILPYYYDTENCDLYARWLTKEEYDSLNGHSFALPGSIASGNSRAISGEAGTSYYYKLVAPKTTTSYTLTSSGNYTGDPYVWLYDVQGNLIASQDDYSGYHFRLSRTLYPNQVVYWRAGDNGNDSKYSYNIKLT